jgi:hypothetical protein
MSNIFASARARNTYRALDQYSVIAHLHTFECLFPPTVKAWHDLQHAGIRPIPVLDKTTGVIRWYRTIHNRPTPNIVLMVERLMRQHRAHLIRFDVAYDIICPIPNIREAAHLLQQTLILRRKQGHMHDEQNGTYWGWKEGGRRPTRNLGLYADRINEHTGKECVHLELRFFRSYVVKKQGIRYPRDLLTINPKDLLLRHAKFSALGIENANRVIRREIRKERQKHAQRKNKKNNHHLDQYRAALPRKIEHILARTGWDRAQVIWDHSPTIRRTGRKKDIPPVFQVPTCLTWKEEDQRRQEQDQSSYCYHSDSSRIPRSLKSLRISKNIGVKVDISTNKECRRA